MLIKRRYPLVYYIDFMVHAASCLRELSLDDMQCIQAKLLPVNPLNNTVDLPEDYQDYIKAGIQEGQYVRPLVETSGLNRITNRGANFIPTTYSEDNNVNAIGIFAYGNYNINWFGTNWNEYGEFIGRNFGAGAGIQDDVFIVVKERNQIQLTDHLAGLDYLVLEYISDGTSADAATHVDSYAIATIQDYIIWQMKETSRTYSTGERQIAEQQYINSRKILRARMSDLTKDKLIRIFQKNTLGSPK